MLQNVEVLVALKLGCLLVQQLAPASVGGAVVFSLIVPRILHDFPL